MVARLRVPPRVDERVAIRGSEVLHASVVGVVLLALAGEQRVQRVMEVVAPLRVAVDAAAVLRRDEPRVVGRALGDDPDVAAFTRRARVHRVDELFDERVGAGVRDRVHGVEPQARRS